MVNNDDPIATIQKKDKSNTYILFGRDIAEIPCFRNSFLYGISGGIGGGLLAFLFTSRPRIAMHTAMALYVNITIGYWFYCRYNRAWDKFNSLKIQGAIQETPYEDINKEPLFKQEEPLVDV